MTDDQDGAPGSTPVPAPGARSPARSRSGRGPSWPAGGGRPAAGRPPRDGSRRTPDPSAAGQRMMRQIAATRRARRQRLVLVMTGLMSVLTLVLSGSAWLLTSYVTSSLGRVNAGTSGTPSSGPVNILVAGIDTRGGLTRHQEIELHVGNSISSNSDTLMLVHIPASHDSVQVVSLPRDSWVSIPGHGMNKINAAYGLGGPQLMVRTVEQATGLQINDYVEVDFLGFVKVINALGGVNICVPFAVDDPDSGLDISAGRHHVDGITALEYARDRHSFALSDIQRISDQQQLLSSLFTEATQTGVLADPIRLQEFLSSVTAAVTVDEGFNLVKLAEEMRGIRSSDVTFTTVPLATMNYLTPSGESAVLWNTAKASALFTWLKNNTGPARPAAHSRSAKGGKASKVSRASVSVDVYNGTQISGLSAATGSQLSALGFHVTRSGLDWSSDTVTRTLIRYPPGQAAAARLLAAALQGAELRETAGLSRIQLVLGAS
ncbi:MAG: LCP family protein, partial [Streptosporangiaceae bacterium]